MSEFRSGDFGREEVLSGEDIDRLAKISERFAGFDFQRRQEWGSDRRWRIRVLPNSSTRQDYRIEVYAPTMAEAIHLAHRELEEIQEANRYYPGNTDT